MAVLRGRDRGGTPCTALELLGICATIFVVFAAVKLGLSLPRIYSDLGNAHPDAYADSNQPKGAHFFMSRLAQAS